MKNSYIEIFIHTDNCFYRNEKKKVQLQMLKMFFFCLIPLHWNFHQYFTNLITPHKMAH